MRCRLCAALIKCPRNRDLCTGCAMHEQTKARWIEQYKEWQGRDIFERWRRK